MLKPLPDQVDILRLARKGEQISGSVELEKLPRLRPGLNETGGRLEVQLELDTDSDNRPYIGGHVQGQLVLECQRCLEDVSEQIDIDFRLVLVKHEDQAKGLPEDEVLVVDTDSVSLYGIIEDEVMLSLPIVIMHPEQECTATGILKELQEPVVQDQADEKENPFAVLKTLKDKI